MSPKAPSSTDSDESEKGSFLDSRKMQLLEQRIDSRYIRKKTSDDRKTIEGVFDTKTLFYLYYLITHGHITYLHGVISTGKEANVYFGERIISSQTDKPQTTTAKSSKPSKTKSTNPETMSIAVKIYRTSTADFKRMREYIIGDPRFKRLRRGIRPLVYAWTQKEYQNLIRMTNAKIKVPTPIVARGNILVMEFIGKDSIPAPRLKDYRYKNHKEALNLFKKLFKYIKRLYRIAELVHADLSEYNVLMLKEPTIIDVSQAVPLEHHNAEEYLERDIMNLVRYFTGLGVETPSVEELLEEIHRE